MIPKKIHYCWFGRGKMPEMARKCIASWKKYLPEYEIKEWKNRFRKELEKYISLPPAYNNSIIPYLVHAQNVEQNGIDYVAVERKLIEKMNKPF